ncbi:MAG: enoyl-CoA hydratase/isomerase family protein, partial [Gammaproteobacteria bacterium]|nr:enoyl-CoA hydratase/isomerase family protein [Gammaproteobacteria bacterium]
MRTLNDESASVVLREHEAGGGQIVAEAHLNVQKTLNSLSVEMTQIITPALKAWGADERIAAIVFTGAGDRAFCAGGDIQALYHAMVRNHAAGHTVDSYPFEFFENEYRMDYLIHTCPKPVVSVGHGVVMGGGLGIFSASRFRVVTETSRIAYPEVTIGLFPDAGGTAMLRS